MGFLKENKIDCITFRSHSSHICQPLDVGVNAAFKRKIGQLYRIEQTNKIEFKKQIIQTLQSSIHAAFSPSIIMEAFKDTGIFSRRKFRSNSSF
jgi:hypothetical protein